MVHRLRSRRPEAIPVRRDAHQRIMFGKGLHESLQRLFDSLYSQQRVCAVGLQVVAGLNPFDVVREDRIDRHFAAAQVFRAVDESHMRKALGHTLPDNRTVLSVSTTISCNSATSERLSRMYVYKGLPAR